MGPSTAGDLQIGHFREQAGSNEGEARTSSCEKKNERMLKADPSILLSMITELMYNGTKIGLFDLEFNCSDRVSKEFY
jgi:hypothetical protein